MSDRSCPNCSRCALFPLFERDSVLRFWQKLYCFADYETCNRYKSAEEGVRPSDDMLPNGDRLEAAG